MINLTFQFITQITTIYPIISLNINGIEFKEFII